jgi:hypothetical protein
MVADGTDIDEAGADMVLLRAKKARRGQGAAPAAAVPRNLRRLGRSSMVGLSERLAPASLCYEAAGIIGGQIAAPARCWQGRDVGEMISPTPPHNFVAERAGARAASHLRRKDGVGRPRLSGQRVTASRVGGP